MRCEIQGAAHGLLKGRTVALKDNICLAGIPMTNGSATLDDYVPDVDATVVTRVLEAGATILGKTTNEHSSLRRQPHPPQRAGSQPLAAGSHHRGLLSGAAAVVAAGDADMAVGGDQGGSIRVPAAFCGLVGLKPTFGLIPYTGIMTVETSLDHTGPMTRTVADNALLLQVLAGSDGLDPRQATVPFTIDYLTALSRGVAGMRVALLKEGFGQPGADPLVEAKVRDGANLLAALGADLSEVSVRRPQARPNAVAGDCVGPRVRGAYVRKRGRRQRARALRHQFARGPCTLARTTGRSVRLLKVVMLLGRYMHRTYRPLLRQGAEPLAQASGRLRPSP